MLAGAGLQALGLGRGGAGQAQPAAVKVKTAAEADTPAEFVALTIQENRALIFSKSYCGFRRGLLSGRRRRRCVGWRLAAGRWWGAGGWRPALLPPARAPR